MGNVFFENFTTDSVARRLGIGRDEQTPESTRSFASQNLPHEANDASIKFNSPCRRMWLNTLACSHLLPRVRQRHHRFSHLDRGRRREWRQRVRRHARLAPRRVHPNRPARVFTISSFARLGPSRSRSSPQFSVALLHGSIVVVSSSARLPYNETTPLRAREGRSLGFIYSRVMTLDVPQVHTCATSHDSPLDRVPGYTTRDQNPAGTVRVASVGIEARGSTAVSGARACGGRWRDRCRG